MIDPLAGSTSASYTTTAAETAQSDETFDASLSEALGASEETETSSEGDLFYASELLSLGGDRWANHDLSLSFSYDGTSSSVPEEVSALPDALSTWQGGSFSMSGLSAGGSELVGTGVEQFHNPSFVTKDGVTYAYFIDHSEGSQFDVGLATSTDGVNFEYQGKVLTKGDSYDAAMASFPSVAYDEGSERWVMAYEGESADGTNSVCLAYSDDGLNWSKQGSIIEPGDAGEISSVDVGTPTLYQEDGTWHVYFHTHAEDGRTRIGYAGGDDLQNLSVSQGAALDVDADGAESQTVGNRSQVFKSGDYYYMFYEVSDNEYFSTDTASWGINLARAESADGPWEKYDGGPVVSNPDYGYGYDGPEVLADGNELYLYYRVAANQTERTLISGLEGWGDSA